MTTYFALYMTEHDMGCLLTVDTMRLVRTLEWSSWGQSVMSDFNLKLAGRKILAEF